MSKRTQGHANEFRIIGGKWRSRRLSLQPNSQLRPTPNRVRETVFNWLGHDVINARCLDLFAGSGALGLEALSRGAKSCDLVELDKGAARQISSNLDLLNIPRDQAGVFANSALEFLKTVKVNQYDIIFLDPPFRQNMMTPLIPGLQLIAQSGCYLYIEIEKSGELPMLPENWSVIREKTAGQVRYHLVLVE